MYNYKYANKVMECMIGYIIVFILLQCTYILKYHCIYIPVYTCIWLQSLIIHVYIPCWVVYLYTRTWYILLYIYIYIYIYNDKYTNKVKECMIGYIIVFILLQCTYILKYYCMYIYILVYTCIWLQSLIIHEYIPCYMLHTLRESSKPFSTPHWC